MKRNCWARRFSPVLAVTLVMVLLVPGCAGQPSAPPAGAPPEGAELLPPDVKLVEVLKLKWTDFALEPVHGMYAAIGPENEALHVALAEEVLIPAIHAAIDEGGPPPTIISAAQKAALAKGPKFAGITTDVAKAMAGAIGGATIGALKGGAPPPAAKATAAKAGKGIAQGFGDAATQIAFGMASASHRSVFIELAFEITNPNPFQIDVGYQWYNISVDGRQIGKVSYMEKMYIPANTSIVVRHREDITLLNDVIIPSLPPPMLLPIHGLTVHPPAVGTGAIETGMDIWAKIRIPSEAEKTRNLEAFVQERGPVGEFTIDDAHRYVGAQYSMGEYVYGTTFGKSYDIANSVTWDVACELGVDSEAGKTIVKKDMSWTAGR